MILPIPHETLMKGMRDEKYDEIEHYSLIGFYYSTLLYDMKATVMEQLQNIQKLLLIFNEGRTRGTSCVDSIDEVYVPPVHRMPERSISI